MQLKSSKDPKLISAVAKPRSPYLFFYLQKLADTKDMVTGRAMIKPSLLSTKCSEMWRKMTEEEKLPFY